MGARGQAFLWTLLVFLLIGVGVLLYLIYLNLPAEPIQLIVNNVNSGGNVNAGNLTKSAQFYPNMRFSDRIISYYIDSRCTQEKALQVTGAFNILEGETPLLFVLSAVKPEIEISCSEIAPPPTDSGHFVAGEGGPYEILNASTYSVILLSKISLYRDETCPTPHIALHEILHALGFDHNNNPLSILYPTLDCKQTLDSYIVDEINSLYSSDSLPDLSIVALNGTKSGRYLSFSISVANRGLTKSEESNLTLVYDTGEVIKEFELGSIDLGATKIFTVTNLATSRGAGYFKFIVDRANSVKELDKSNNEAELILSG